MLQKEKSLLLYIKIGEGTVVQAGHSSGKKFVLPGFQYISSVGTAMPVTTRRGIMVNTKHLPENAVSEVVGEMLMVGLAILLISVFASVLGTLLPAAHDPSITIVMTNDTYGNITLWHKGGDWVKVSDLRVVILNKTASVAFSSEGSPHSFDIFPQRSLQNSVFEVNSSITVKAPWVINERGDTVNLVTDRARIFVGALP